MIPIPFLQRTMHENRVIVRYEALKAHIQSVRRQAQQKIHFFFSLHSELPLAEHLKNAAGALEQLAKLAEERSQPPRDDCSAILVRTK